MSHSQDLKKAHAAVSDLFKPNALIYWADFLICVGFTHVALYKACLAHSSGSSALFLLLGVLPFYRALAFIHEITHLSSRAVPGFRWAWNLLFGVPFLLPSIFYSGVHRDHHNPKSFGTRLDPEYYPLGHGTLLGTIVFLIVPLFAPVMLPIRFLVLAPLSYVSPRIRQVVYERFSAMAINPGYCRPALKKDYEIREFTLFEGLATLWASSLAALGLVGIVPMQWFLCWAGLSVMGYLLNQIRTVAAHRWENHHEEMSFEEQLLDSVNYDGTSLLVELWAPVGLRYHGLHHWLPGLPYHALPEAHRRLMKLLPQDASYRKTVSGGLKESFRRLRSFQLNSSRR